MKGSDDTRFTNGLKKKHENPIKKINQIYDYKKYPKKFHSEIFKFS